MQSKYVAAVDAGGTTLRAAIMEDGRIVESSRIKLPIQSIEGNLERFVKGVVAGI